VKLGAAASVVAAFVLRCAVAFVVASGFAATCSAAAATVVAACGRLLGGRLSVECFVGVLRRFGKFAVRTFHGAAVGFFALFVLSLLIEPLFLPLSISAFWLT